MKCGRNFQTFQNALDVHANQDTERMRAKKAIESIFPVNKFILNNINNVGGKNTTQKKPPPTRTKIHRNLTVQKEVQKPPLANFFNSAAGKTAQKDKMRTTRVGKVEKPMPPFIQTAQKVENPGEIGAGLLQQKRDLSKEK